MEERLSNPFTPVVGKVPLHFAGRNDVLSDIDDVILGDSNSPASVSLFVGARGTGKTALLNYYADAAEGRGWISVCVTCAEGMLEEVLLRSKRAAAHLVEVDSPRRVKSASIANVGSITWEDSSRDSSNWRMAMDGLLDALDEAGAESNEAVLEYQSDEVSLQSDEDIASGTSGTCTWVIDSEGALTVRPTDGETGTLGMW